MKKIIVLNCFLLLFIVPLFAQKQKTAPLDIIMGEIEKSYQYAVNNIDNTIELSEVAVSFTLSSEIAKGGSLKIWIIKLGRKDVRKNTKSVTFKLAKKEKKDVGAAMQENNSALTNLILAAARDFKTLNEKGILLELNDRGFTVETGLTITRDTNGGAEYTIGIFTLSAEGGKTKEQGHTISLTFKKKDTKK